MILDKVNIRVGVEAGRVNTGTVTPRKFIADKLKVMLKEFLDTGKTIKVMVQVEKSGKKYREYYVLNKQ